MFHICFLSHILGEDVWVILFRRHKHYLNHIIHNIFSDEVISHIGMLGPYTLLCIISHDDSSHIITMHNNWFLHLYLHTFQYRFNKHDISAHFWNNHILQFCWWQCYMLLNSWLPWEIDVDIISSDAFSIIFITCQLTITKCLQNPVSHWIW